MAHIESSLGKRTFESTEDPKHFVVEDKSNDSSDVSEHEKAKNIMAERERLISEANKSNTSEDNNTSDKKINLEFSEEDLAISRKHKLALLNKATHGDRRRIELLTGIGRAYKEVVVKDGDDKIVFTIHTLKSKERGPLFAKQDMLVKSFSRNIAVEIKHMTLAYVVSSIDGISLDEILSCTENSDEEKFNIRKSFFEEMDEAVTNYLLSNFEELEIKNKKRFSIQSQNDVKEVAEQLKKSS